MAGVNGVSSVPANEEINVMALKMKENFQKTVSVTMQQQGLSNANIYININGGRITTISPSNSTLKENVEKSNDCEDICSIKGIFSWEEIGKTPIPYIMRIINNEKLKFVSVRIAESELLSRLLNLLHADVYTCPSVRSYFITTSEAKLLNEMLVKHSVELAYGKEPFQAGKDYIVRLEDVIEFYTFLDVCYNKLMDIPQINETQKCGFIRVDSDLVVSYCYKDNQKYVPLFYFDGETEYLRDCAIKLENWDLAYLKFCCKLQGVDNELFDSDSCIVTSLDIIKNYFPPDTNFEEYWPSNVVDIQVRNNHNNSQLYSPGAWIRAPTAVLNEVPTSE